MDPESKLLVAIDVGNRTLAMAQCIVGLFAQSPKYVVHNIFGGLGRKLHLGDHMRC
jgi:hypothetical protein